MTPAQVHYPQSVRRPHFLLHSIQVILNGLLGKAELVRDLLVRGPSCQQRHEFLLALCQSQESRTMEEGMHVALFSK